MICYIKTIKGTLPEKVCSSEIPKRKECDMHSTTNLNPVAQEPTQPLPAHLAWLDETPKRYKVQATGLALGDNGKQVLQTITHTETDYIKYAQQVIKDIKKGTPEWTENGIALHPFFGIDVNKVQYTIKDTQPPTDEELMAEFSHFTFGEAVEEEKPTPHFCYECDGDGEFHHALHDKTGKCKACNGTGFAN